LYRLRHTLRRRREDALRGHCSRPLLERLVDAAGCQLQIVIKEDIQIVVKEEALS
jgi:hypothetical protein